MWEPVANTEIQPNIDDQSSITLGESNESNYPNISLHNLEKIPFHRGMSMACLNINSLFAMINNKVDLLCINETKLDSSINDNEVHIPNFEVIRRNRRANGRHGGGICIYIRSNINYKIRHNLQSETLENLVVEIKKPRSKSILVSTWYRPPDLPTSYFAEFEQMINGSFDAENLEYFLLGDLNREFKFYDATGSTTRLRKKEICHARQKL